MERENEEMSFKRDEMSCPLKRQEHTPFHSDLPDVGVHIMGFS